MSSRGNQGEDRAAVSPATAPGKDEEPEDDSIEILEVVGVDETTGLAESPEAGSAEETPSPPAAPGPPGQGGAHTALQDAIQEKERYYDLLLRKQAEFDNFRKRSDKERREARSNAYTDLFRIVLPVLDNLERALRTSEGSDDPLRQGVMMIQQQLLDLLVKEGLEPLDTSGARFDPHLHEAVEVVDVPGCEQGVILEEMRRGYVFKDRLIRAALVRVSSGRSPRNEDEDGGAEQAS